MGKIQKFDKKIADVVAQRIQAALAGLGEELGVSIRAGGGTFLGGSFTLKLKVGVLGADGLADDGSGEAFKMYADILGMKKDDLGRELTLGGKLHKLVGYKPRRSKFPMVCLRLEDGLTYLFKEESVKRALGIKVEREEA